MKYPFTETLAVRTRLKSLEVAIGDCPVGGVNPIRIQSMTNTDTLDIEASVKQARRLVESGCDYVRLTAPNLEAAKALGEIKKRLRADGFRVPLIADIHFTPNAAELAARLVEKVRVNPGNYIDRKAFKHIEYDDAAYREELGRLHERFSPLVKICRENGTAMRIGANHGSLSDRILSRFGDTPRGMVESALEFLDICEDHDFRQVVFSMKASNTRVMVQAYRLLVSRMEARGRIYPIHLGVTEAGEGEDGRLKSAAGIGALLLDGIGDTIRVSLTENPEVEAPVARRILLEIESKTARNLPEPVSLTWDAFTFSRRQTRSVAGVGGGEAPVLMAATKAGVASTGTAAPDFRIDQSAGGQKATHSGSVVPAPSWKGIGPGHFPLYETFAAFRSATHPHGELNLVKVRRSDMGMPEFTDDVLSKAILILTPETEDTARELRLFCMELDGKKVACPVLAPWDSLRGGKEERLLAMACGLGPLLLDGRLDGLWLENPQVPLSTAWNLLQACRLRMSKTEFISCPSCGRTQFELQAVSARIRERLGHLPGLKVAVMGCIVNGPGEMADADFGYVGTGPGKISLYKGHEVLVRNLDESVAVDRLVELIRENGKWFEKAPS